MGQLDIDGCGVAQADLERSWGSAELSDRCWLFRSPTTWTLVTMRRRVRYGDFDQPRAGIELLDAGYEQDTTSPGGKLVFHQFGDSAEFERDLIRERTQAGLAAARARGRNGGRPLS